VSGTPDMYEIASVLGAHGFRVKPLLVGRARGVATLEDVITGEPIALVTETETEARQLAAWLESERPLPARPVPYRLEYDCPPGLEHLPPPPWSLRLLDTTPRPPYTDPEAP
jgi:hypothetical protein